MNSIQLVLPNEPNTDTTTIYVGKINTDSGIEYYYRVKGLVDTAQKLDIDNCSFDLEYTTANLIIKPCPIQTLLLVSKGPAAISTSETDLKKEQKAAKAAKAAELKRNQKEKEEKRIAKLASNANNINRMMGNIQNNPTKQNNPNKPIIGHPKIKTGTREITSEENKAVEEPDVEKPDVEEPDVEESPRNSFSDIEEEEEEENEEFGQSPKNNYSQLNYGSNNAGIWGEYEDFTKKNIFDDKDYELNPFLGLKQNEKGNQTRKPISNRHMPSSMSRRNTPNPPKEAAENKSSRAQRISAVKKQMAKEKAVAQKKQNAKSKIYILTDNSDRDNFSLQQEQPQGKGVIPTLDQTLKITINKTDISTQTTKQIEEIHENFLISRSYGNCLFGIYKSSDDDKFYVFNKNSDKIVQVVNGTPTKLYSGGCNELIFRMTTLPLVYFYENNDKEQIKNYADLINNNKLARFFYKSPTQGGGNNNRTLKHYKSKTTKNKGQNKNKKANSNTKKKKKSKSNTKKH